MKMKASTSRKLRYGGVTAALTILIIAAVILVNVIFSALSQKFLWYVDLTPDRLFTLSDECIDLIRNGDDTFANSSSPVEMVKKIREENRVFNVEHGYKPGDSGYKDENITINLIFCDDPDTLQGNNTQNYVYHTALQLEEEFPDYITVQNYNIIRNPSSVTRFKANSLSTIATTSVIIEFGTEFRVCNLRYFYTFNSSSDEEPWAYNGEKAFASSILAVTRAESPVACVTTNHGESFTDTSFLTTLTDAGFIVRELNLAADEIPEDCRLIVVFDPTSDFMVNDGISDVDEIEKLDKFLDGTNSMMVFMSPESPVLPHFEEYLAEWGISYDRYTDSANQTHPYMIKDTSHSLTTNGYTVKSEYTADNPASSITSDMRSRPYAPDVIFQNAMSISYSDLYSPVHYVSEDDDSISYDYASYSVDGTSRSIYNLFTSYDSAVAMANGEQVARATANNKFALMTVSVEDRTTQESNYTTINEASYVIACGSTDFASETLLQSNAYGNTDLLLSACRAVGREPVPVGLTFKPFADYTIDTVTTAEATQYTVVFAVVPAVLALGSGIFVLVRRKNR